MTRQFDQLVPIDIPMARKALLKAATDYRRQHAIALIFEAFLMSLDPAKKVTKAHAAKLHERLTQDEALLVSRVDFKADTGKPWRDTYYFEVHCYTMDEPVRFTLRRSAEPPFGGWDVENALIGYRQSAALADYLENNQITFANRAKQFNQTLELLRDISRFADGPEDLKMKGVWPLTDFFHWYQLSR